MPAAERSLALACERESAANSRAQNLEETLQATKEEVAAAAADKAGLQEEIMDMLKQGRLREVRARYTEQTHALRQRMLKAIVRMLLSNCVVA